VAGEDRAEPSAATGSGAAGDPYPALRVLAGGATGAGAAYDATATTGAASTSANAGVAEGTGEAFNPGTVASGVVVSGGVSTAGRHRRRPFEPQFRPSLDYAPSAYAYPMTAFGEGEAFDAMIEWNDDETALALLLEAA
jgi:hypothetical protein